MVRREWRTEDDYVMRMQRRGEWNLAAAAASIRVSFDLGPIMKSSGNDAWIFFSPDPPWTFVPIMHPFSGPRLYWNLPCIMLICYDIFFVPLESSFDVPFHISFRIVDWFPKDEARLHVSLNSLWVSAACLTLFRPCPICALCHVNCLSLSRSIPSVKVSLCHSLCDPPPALHTVARMLKGGGGSCWGLLITTCFFFCVFTDSC